MNSSQQPANQSQLVYEDEISLVDIVKVLLRRKKIIIGITAVAVCIGLVYAFSQQRVYQVETILLPPSFENVQLLNVLGDKNDFKSEDVFGLFTKNAKSLGLRQTFFNDYKIIETLVNKSSQDLTEEEIYDLREGFSKSLKVTSDIASNSAKITLEGIQKEKIGPWVDSFVAMVAQETVNQLIKNIQMDIDSKIKSLTTDISSKRNNYKIWRENKVARLLENVQIAKKLGIRDHIFVPNVDSSTSRTAPIELSIISKALSNKNDLSSYMKGTRVLLAEIDGLKNRKNDDIHILGLRDLQEQLTRLEAINIDKNKLKTVKTVIVDKKAIIGIEPIRPNRKFMVILSLVLGGVLGVFSVFILEFMSNFKKQVNNESDLDTA